LGDIIVGIISFRRNIKFSLKNSFKKRLLVFDIQPVRSSFYQSMVYDYEYQIPDIAISFLDHIDMLAKKFDLEIILKRKITTNVTDKKYLNNIFFLHEINALINSIILSIQGKIGIYLRIISISSIQQKFYIKKKHKHWI